MNTVSSTLAVDVVREFDAPRALVFRAWSSAEHCAQWFGPRDFSVLACEVDFREGGRYRALIRAPEGTDYWFGGIYREIVEPERLVFTFAWEDEGERGLETLITVEFSDIDGKTRMRFHQTPFQSQSERDDHESGWNECFDRLAAHLARTGE